jgi:hypothetical protein
MGVTAWMYQIDPEDASTSITRIAKWLYWIHAGINVVLPLVKIPNEMLTVLHGILSRCIFVPSFTAEDQSKVNNKKTCTQFSSNPAYLLRPP